MSAVTIWWRVSFNKGLGGGKYNNIFDVILTGHGLLDSYVMLKTSNIQQTNKQTNKQAASCY